MTPWAIRWTRRALKDLEGLEPMLARRVVRRLEQAAGKPSGSFTRLVGNDDSKLRIGDFRLLAILSHDTRTIPGERVDHRSMIYERGR